MISYTYHYELHPRSQTYLGGTLGILGLILDINMTNTTMTSTTMVGPLITLSLWECRHLATQIWDN